MTTLLVILFFVGALLMAFRVFSDSWTDAMPTSCPRCAGPDDHIHTNAPITAGVNRWYRDAPGGKFRCRHCQTVFKNHPNGSLVEDRDEP